MFPTSITDFCSEEMACPLCSRNRIFKCNLDLFSSYDLLYLFPPHRNFTFNPYPTAFPYGNGMVLHFYQQQESSTTKTVHKVIKKGLKTYV